MKNRILFILFLFLVSCFSTRKHKEYAYDFKTLSKEEYFNKYYTLNISQKENHTNIRINEAYILFRPNDSLQIYVFSDDGYVYSSVLLSGDDLNKLSNIKLYGARIFSINNKTIKLEKVVSNPEGVFSYIKEGIIEKDTIFINKAYPSKNNERITKLSEKLIIAPHIKVYKFGDYFVAN